MHKKKYRSQIIIIIICIITITVSMLTVNETTSNNLLKSIVISINKYTLPKIEMETIQEDTIKEELEKEIRQLKEALKLNSTLSEYEIENATVLSRNKSYWLNNIIIDKGTTQGLKKNMAVITNAGMIGIISKVYKTSSEIKLITANDKANKISVSIKIGDIDTYGILNGYEKEKHLIKIVEVDKDTDVKVGDSVMTSGLSEYIPRGLYIGQVTKIEKDKYNLSKKIYVQTKQDFNNIHYVTVLKEIK